MREMCLFRYSHEDVQGLERMAWRLMLQEKARLEILENELRKTQDDLGIPGLPDHHVRSLQEELGYLKHETTMIKANEATFRYLTPLARVGVLAAFGTYDGGLPRVERRTVRDLGELVDEFLEGEHGDLCQTLQAAKAELEHILSCNACWSECLASSGESHRKLDTAGGISRLCRRR